MLLSHFFYFPTLFPQGSDPLKSLNLCLFVKSFVLKITECFMVIRWCLTLNTRPSCCSTPWRHSSCAQSGEYQQQIRVDQSEMRLSTWTTAITKATTTLLISTVSTVTTEKLAVVTEPILNEYNTVVNVFWTAKMTEWVRLNQSHLQDCVFPTSLSHRFLSFESNV